MQQVYRNVVNTRKKLIKITKTATIFIKQNLQQFLVNAWRFTFGTPCKVYDLWGEHFAEICNAQCIFKLLTSLQGQQNNCHTNNEQTRERLSYSSLSIMSFAVVNESRHLFIVLLHKFQL